MVLYVYLQFVAHLVFGILWLIVTIVQVVVGLIAWLVWYIIRKVVEEKCTQDDARDLCVCDADKSVPFTGKEKKAIYIITFSLDKHALLSTLVTNRLLIKISISELIEHNRKSNRSP